MPSWTRRNFPSLPSGEPNVFATTRPRYEKAGQTASQQTNNYAGGRPCICEYFKSKITHMENFRRTTTATKIMAHTGHYLITNHNDS